MNPESEYFQISFSDLQSPHFLRCVIEQLNAIKLVKKVFFEKLLFFHPPTIVVAQNHNISLLESQPGGVYRCELKSSNDEFDSAQSKCKRKKRVNARCAILAKSKDSHAKPS